MTEERETLLFRMRSTLDPGEEFFLHKSPWNRCSGVERSIESRIEKTTHKTVVETIASRFDVDKEKGVSRFYVNPKAGYTLSLFDIEGACYTENKKVADAGYSMMTKDGGMVLYCWYGIEHGKNDYQIIHYISHSPIYLPRVMKGTKGEGNLVIDCEIIDEQTGKKGTARGTMHIKRDNNGLHLDTRNVLILGEEPIGVDIEIKESCVAVCDKLQDIAKDTGWAIQAITLSTTQ